MSAVETLRRAADLLDQRADAAPGGRWRVEPLNPGWIVTDTRQTFLGILDVPVEDIVTRPGVAGEHQGAEHIAALDPPVARALAAALRQVADDAAQANEEGIYAGTGIDEFILAAGDPHPLLVVARAYLREEAQT